MVDEPYTASQMYMAKCECCGEKFTGFYGVSSVVHKFAKEHEDTCFKKHDCLR